VSVVLKLQLKKRSADGINWTFSPMVDISRDPTLEEFLKVQVKMLFRKSDSQSNGQRLNKMIYLK
jgi:hypothetical protein